MNYPEPDASTAMAIGSDPTTAASDITYSIGPQVGSTVQPVLNGHPREMEMEMGN